MILTTLMQTTHIPATDVCLNLKTADKGALAIVDYFSVGSDNKAVSVPISGFTYSPDKWYGVKK